MPGKLKKQDQNMQDQVSKVENARPENAGTPRNVANLLR